VSGFCVHVYETSSSMKDYYTISDLSFTHITSVHESKSLGRKISKLSNTGGTMKTVQ
jgi:hypothetical protein